MESAADADLLSRLRAGDRSAATELVKRYHPRLLSVARSLLRNSGDAEDALQEAWISALRAIDGFDGRCSLLTWLTRIVINSAKMRLRRQGRELSLEELQDPDQSGFQFSSDGHWQSSPIAWHFSGPEELLCEQDLQRCLDHTLLDMPENQRVVLTMRDIQGMELDEICNSLEIGASNVRVLLHRARTRVYRMIDRYTETGLC